MAQKKRRTFREIAEAIRTRTLRSVQTENERKSALQAAAAFNKNITTRANKVGGFDIIYLP